MQHTAMKSVVQPAPHVARWYDHLVWFSVLIALFLAPSAIRAQIAGTANIQGTVADSSGAVVANAGITSSTRTRL